MRQGLHQSHTLLGGQVSFLAVGSGQCLTAHIGDDRQHGRRFLVFKRGLPLGLGGRSGHGLAECVIVGQEIGCGVRVALQFSGQMGSKQAHANHLFCQALRIRLVLCQRFVIGFEGLVLGHQGGDRVDDQEAFWRLVLNLKAVTRRDVFATAHDQMAGATGDGEHTRTNRAADRLASADLVVAVAVRENRDIHQIAVGRRAHHGAVDFHTTQTADVVQRFHQGVTRNIGDVAARWQGETAQGDAIGVQIARGHFVGEHQLVGAAARLVLGVPVVRAAQVQAVQPNVQSWFARDVHDLVALQHKGQDLSPVVHRGPRDRHTTDQWRLCIDGDRRQGQGLTQVARGILDTCRELLCALWQ